MPSFHEVILFRLEANPPAYLWSGTGDLPVPADALAGATTYRGAGALLDVPEVKQLINGVADRIEVSVSGVDMQTQRYAAEDADSVPGSTVRFGTLVMDEFNQIAGMVDWEWEGVADVVGVDRTADENGGVVRSVSLSIGAGDTGRSKSDLTFFTDADQRRRSPDDAFFSHIGQISATVTRPFGPA
jgi:hypothetical protein